jgi:hypothetical protein
MTPLLARLSGESTDRPQPPTERTSGSSEGGTSHNPNDPWFSEGEVAKVATLGDPEILRKVKILASRRRWDIVKSTVAQEITERYEKERAEVERRTREEKGRVIAR